jgi:hypothetical protein
LALYQIISPFLFLSLSVSDNSTSVSTTLCRAVFSGAQQEGSCPLANSPDVMLATL